MSNWLRDLYGIRVSSEVSASAAISSNTLTLDISAASVFYVNLNADINTFNIDGEILTPGAQSFTLIFTADGTARTVTWPASVNWPNATAPTMTAANGKKDIFTFLTLDGGVYWYGFIAGQIYA